MQVLPNLRVLVLDIARSAMGALAHVSDSEGKVLTRTQCNQCRSLFIPLEQRNTRGGGWVKGSVDHKFPVPMLTDLLLNNEKLGLRWQTFPQQFVSI